MEKILGIEFGSTRIKSVLTDENGNVLATGGYEWENSLVDGIWTYPIEKVLEGCRESFRLLNEDYKSKYLQPVKTLSAIGISAMMHGYLAFNGDKLLVPFRTWRNTITAKAADELTELFEFNVPQRWSVSHFYQAILNGEPHVKDVDFLTTLAGYVHWKLTGKKVLGIGDASGMFPIEENDYSASMVKKFNALIKEKGIEKDVTNILPKVLLAGEYAGTLTEDGAKFLDPSGTLQAGAIVCPPEGDAGTGMVATNSVKEKTGNVSAGTSAFVMLVLEKALSRVYKEIDVVTTPDGKPVAMVHVNNCTSEINRWSSIFDQVLGLFGAKVSKGELMTALFKKSLESDKEIGGLTAYNFLSGEPIANTEQGCPLILRRPDGEMSLANFMQSQIYSALGSLALGMEILKDENVSVNAICGHGGFFKTEFVGQNAMSAALNAPVTVMDNAGEGGAWGIAILAIYALRKKGSLSEFLDEFFKDVKKNTVIADQEERKKFDNFMIGYRRNLQVAKTASELA